MQQSVTKKNRYYNITLLALDKDDITQTKEYHPITTVDNVLLSAKSKQTIASHFSTGKDRVHLTEREREILTKDAKAGGLVRLDQYGHIPLEETNPTILALYYEFQDIPDLLSHSIFTIPEDFGRLVMVRDASGDTRGVIASTWAIYRFIGQYGANNIDAYQKILDGHDMDRPVTWENMNTGIKSLVQDIDDAVNHRHRHSNKDALDGIFTDRDGNFYFKGKRVIFREEFHTMIPTEDPNLINIMPGDMALKVTEKANVERVDENSVPHIDPPIVLMGNCDGEYEGDLSITKGANLRTGSVTSMNQFFKNCLNLTYVPYYDTDNCESMEEFAYGCENLTTIAPISFKSTKSLKSFAENSGITQYGGEIVSETALNTDRMFAKCSKLQYIGYVNLPSVVSAREMFANSGLKRIDSAFKMESVEDTYMMFTFCTDLTSVYSIKTPKAKNMSYMFARCDKLKFINYLDFSSCTDATGIFYHCDALETVTIKENSLGVDLSFANTSLTIEGFRNVIKGMNPRYPHSIDLTGTPAATQLTAEDSQAVAEKAWTLHIE